MSTPESIKHDAKMDPIYKQARLDELGDIADYLAQLMESPILALMKDIDETYWAETHEKLDDILYDVVREMEYTRDE